MLRWMLSRNVAQPLLPVAPALLTASNRLEGGRAGQRRPRTAPRQQRPLGLDAAATGLPCRVVSVTAPTGQADWARWLAEIGFLPGEAVTVQARSAWGGDPMVVRIAESTFALRRAEAACVQVQPVAEPA